MKNSPIKKVLKKSVSALKSALPAGAMDDVDQWESGALGRDEKHVKKAPVSARVSLDQALKLEAISIRLSSELIQQYKTAAFVLGLGYQPLMRDAIERMANVYLGEAMRELAEKKLQADASVALSSVKLKKMA